MREPKQPRPSGKILSLCLILSPASAFADDQHDSNSWIATLIVVLSLIFLLITAAVAAFIRRYGNGILGAATEGHREEVAPPSQGGLDAAEVESLPSLRFSEIKMRRLRQEELTCAVCLSEFQDSDILRLLPDCCHVCHPHCIAPWLASHVTCPVCRASLEHGEGSGVSMSSIPDRLSSAISLSEASDHQSQHRDDHHTMEEMV